MPSDLSEIFFRPQEIARERLSLPAPIYNQCRLMLARCRHQHIFVPVRTLQVQAVIDEHEVIFVDNQAYAVKDGEGGKLIKLAWKFRPASRGDNLSEPAAIELVYYAGDAREMHTRLVVEFKKALDQIQERSLGQSNETPGKKVLSFTSR